MPADVVITGLGLVTPAGRTASATWEALLAGVRCVGPLQTLRADGRPHLGARLPAKRAGSGPSTSPSSSLPSIEPVCAMAVEAAREAFVQAGLPGSGCAVSIGTSKGGIDSLTALYDICVYNSYRGLRTPNRGNNLYGILSNSLPDGAARQVAASLGATGPVAAPVAACATGTLAVIAAARLIADRRATAALAGGSDASLNALWLAAFERMAVLAREHPVLGPPYSCRPFDACRCGFVPGEGAGVLALESAASARRRGVRPLARILGWASGSDPVGLTSGSADGAALAGVVLRACCQAGVDPGDLVGIVAHGTGTPANDIAEIRGLRAAIGDQLPNVAIVSIKGALGHLLGAAGAVELGVAAMMCRERTCPPNATLTRPDPGLGRLCLPTEPHPIKPGPILKTSSGFGGHVAAVILG